MTESAIRIQINNGPQVHGELSIETEMVTYAAGASTKPNLGWEMVDAAGHFHAYTRDGTLPTLEVRYEHVDCTMPEEHDDDDCEGYDVAHWHCLICGEEVTPGRLPDSGVHSMPGRKTWTVKVHALLGMGERVSVRVRSPRWVYFGVGQVDAVMMDGFGSATSTVLGIGELGRREPQSAHGPRRELGAA